MHKVGRQTFRRNARRALGVLTRLYGLPVQGVSIPRSGNHLLSYILDEYAYWFKFCEFYRENECCKTVPCKWAGAYLVKSHDFNFTMPVSSKIRYLVQVRPLVPTLVSHYEFAVADRTELDSQSAWASFAWKWIHHRKRFVDKWVIDMPNEVSYITIHYQDLITEPVLEVHRAVDFIWRGWRPNIKRIERAVNMQRKVPPRQLEKFRYYDPSFFKILSDELSAHDVAIEALRRFK